MPFISFLFSAATVRSGSSSCCGLSLPAPSRGIGGDSACLSRRTLVQIGLNCRSGFIGGRERTLGSETLVSDPFGRRARRSGGSLVDVCRRTLEVGGCLQRLGILQCGILGLVEVRQYEWLRRKLQRAHKSALEVRRRQARGPNAQRLECPLRRFAICGDSRVAVQWKENDPASPATIGQRLTVRPGSVRATVIVEKRILVNSLKHVCLPRVDLPRRQYGATFEPVPRRNCRVAR
jgi:hypothetical protein